MEIGARKTIWWLVMACSASGLAIWLIIVLMRGFSSNNALIWIPFVSPIFLVVSCLALRKLYREQPSRFSGHWQVSLGDLVFISTSTGLFMAFWRATLSADSIAYLLMGLLTTVLLLFSLLLAARTGFPTWQVKYIFAVGHLFRLLGFIGTGLFAFFIILMLFVEPSHLSDILRDVFIENRSGPVLLVWPMRVGLAVLIPGLLMCELSLRYRILPEERQESDASA